MKSKQMKREEARMRQVAYDQLSTADKLAKLQGFTATKQRAKLAKKAGT